MKRCSYNKCSNPTKINVHTKTGVIQWRNNPYSEGEVLHEVCLRKLKREKGDNKIECSQCNEYRVKYSGTICEHCYKTNRMNNASKIKCQCSPECPDIIPSITFNGDPRTFVKGHEMRGPNGPNYKGGIKESKEGYYTYKFPNHPYATKDGYVAGHRLVMEQYYSIIFDEEVFLPYPKYEIHHIDENVKNNSLINLELVTHKEHRKLHEIDMSDRFCCSPDCKEPTKVYYDKIRNRPMWRKNIFSSLSGDYLHEKCFKRKFRKNEKK